MMPENTLNFKDPAMIPQWTIGIGSIICNAITYLWHEGYKEAARAKVQFLPDQTEFGNTARKNGVEVYTLFSPDDQLYIQFPNCMFFLIPSQFATEIIKGVFKMRKEIIEDLIEFDREEAAEEAAEAAEAAQSTILKP
jgi:hypothetical protein